MGKTQNQPLLTAEIVRELSSGNLSLTLLNPIAANVDQISMSDWIERIWNEPLEYPGLGETVLAGDQVALVVQDDSPVANEVAALLAQRLHAELQAQVSIAVSPLAWEHFWNHRESETVGNVIRHDAADPNGLAMLAVGADDQALYVNRVLFDADVVIPIACLSSREDPQYVDCIVPAFTGEENKTRYAELSSKQQAAEIRQINRNLGTFINIQIALAPGNQIESIRFGEREAVNRRAMQDLARVWQVPMTSKQDFVVGTVESAEFQQSWQDVANALIAADECTVNQGAILISCGLHSLPPRDVRLGFVTDEIDLPKNAPQIARQIASICKRHPVYLHSQLNQNETESLGFGFVSDLDEIRRLIDRNGRSGILRDAHQCLIKEQ